MKIFILVFLVVACQAELFGEEKAVFKFLSSISMDKITETVEGEMNKLIHRELSPEEIRLVRELAEDFTETVRDEVSKAIAKVEEAGHLSREFTERMFDNMKLAASEIGHGLKMSPEILQQFVENMLKDISEIEGKGDFQLDLDQTFRGIIEKAIARVHDKFSERRDLDNIWNKRNDTIRKIIGHLHGRFHDLGDFFEDTMKIAVDKIQPHIDNIKTLAKDFLKYMYVIKASVLRQAIEFFRPFSSKMGNLWDELFQRTRERLDQLSEVTHTPF